MSMSHLSEIRAKYSWQSWHSQVDIINVKTSSNHRLGSAFDVMRVFVFGKLVRNCCYKNVWGASVLYCVLFNIVY